MFMLKVDAGRLYLMKAMVDPWDGIPKPMPTRSINIEPLIRIAGIIRGIVNPNSEEVQYPVNPKVKVCSPESLDAQKKRLGEKLPEGADKRDALNAASDLVSKIPRD